MTETELAIEDCRCLRKSYDNPSVVNESEQFYHEEQDDRHVFAIAGTDSTGALRDWILNLSKRLKTLTREPRISVHRGFLAGAEMLFSAIESIAAVNDKPVHLTGHSRGGPVASICALVLASTPEYSDRKVSLTTFASPYWTKSQIDAKVLEESHRYKTKGDFIADWPEVTNRTSRPWVMFGTEHVLGEEKDRHPGAFFDVWDVHSIANYELELRLLNDKEN